MAAKYDDEIPDFCPSSDMQIEKLLKNINLC